MIYVDQYLMLLIFVTSIINKNNNNKYDLINKTLLKASKHLKYEIYEYTRTRERKNGNVKRKTKLKDFKADRVIAVREKKSEH